MAIEELVAIEAIVEIGAHVETVIVHHAVTAARVATGPAPAETVPGALAVTALPVATGPAATGRAATAPIDPAATALRRRTGPRRSASGRAGPTARWPSTPSPPKSR